MRPSGDSAGWVAESRFVSCTQAESIPSARIVQREATSTRHKTRLPRRRAPRPQRPLSAHRASGVDMSEAPEVPRFQVAHPRCRADVVRDPSAGSVAGACGRVRVSHSAAPSSRAPARGPWPGTIILPENCEANSETLLRSLHQRYARQGSRSTQLPLPGHRCCVRYTAI